MKFNVITGWLAAGLWLLLMKMEQNNALDSDCAFVPPIKTNFLKIATMIACELHNRTTLPTDFGENVEGLSMSSLGRIPIAIVADAPLKISSLKFLALTHLSSFSVPKNFFSILRNLEALVTIEVKFVKDVPQLPTSIKLLALDKVEPPYDLSKLHNLESFSYFSSNLTEFPSIPSTAPLKDVSLNDNPLTKLTLPDIAQYCLLNGTDLTSTNIQNSSETAYCELAAWFKSHNITAALSSSNKVINLSKCPAIPENAVAVSKYKDCLSGGWWLHIVLIVVGIAVCSFIIGMVWYFWFKNKNDDN